MWISVPKLRNQEKGEASQWGCGWTMRIKMGKKQPRWSQKPESETMKPLRVFHPQGTEAVEKLKTAWGELS